MTQTSEQPLVQSEGKSSNMGRATFRKQRVEALSDGIFAVAMTLLVFNLKPPADVPHDQLWAALQADSAAWGSFALTFAIAALLWSLQHRVFDALEHVSRHKLNLTFVTLGFVSVLPFSTSMVAHEHGDHLAFELYFANQLAIVLSLAVQMEVARVQGALIPGVATQHTRVRVWWVSLMMASTILSAIWLPPRFIWVLPATLGVGRRVFERIRDAQRERHARRNIPG